MEYPEKNSLASFQWEIAQFQKDEEEGRKTSAHLTGREFNVAELTERDSEIWEKIKNGSITMDEFQKYSFEVEKDGNQSRSIFKAMAANIATTVIGNKYLESQRQK